MRRRVFRRPPRLVYWAFRPKTAYEIRGYRLANRGRGSGGILLAKRPISGRPANLRAPPWNFGHPVIRILGFPQQFGRERMQPRGSTLFHVVVGFLGWRSGPKRRPNFGEPSWPTGGEVSVAKLGSTAGFAIVPVKSRAIQNFGFWNFGGKLWGGGERNSAALRFLTLLSAVSERFWPKRGREIGVS